jgi:hypothetical protein
MFMSLKRYRIPLEADLSEHASLSISFLKETYMTRHWNWSVICLNPNFGWYWVQQLPDAPWNWRILTRLSFFSWKWIDEFPDADWDWAHLSKKVPGIEMVQKYIGKPWDWEKLTQSEAIPVEIMMKFSDLPWTVNQLLFTQIGLPELRFIDMFSERYDHDAWIDHTDRVQWSIMKQAMHLPWYFTRVDPASFEESDLPLLVSRKDEFDWHAISRTMDLAIIKRYPDLPWIHDGISMNAAVSLKDIHDIGWVRWNLVHVSFKDEARLWHAANVIKKYWKRAACDPSYVMCRKILAYECYAMNVTNASDITINM